MQGLSQLQGLRRQFVPLMPLEVGKQEQLGDIFFNRYSKKQQI